MQTLLKLLAPIKSLKRRYIVYILTSAFFGVIWPFQAFVVSKAIKGMETQNMPYFKTYMIVFFAWLVFIYATNYLIRTSRKITMRKFHQTLYNKYLQKYITSDNNKIEGLGTGQSNSIVQKGCDNWRNIVNDVLLTSYVRIFVSLTTICAVIWSSLGRKILLICLVVFGCITLLARWGNSRMREIRASRREVFIKTDRSIVRLIMSKFEILQNNKIAKELKHIADKFNQIIFRDKKESAGYVVASDIPRALIDFTKWGFVARYGMQILSGHSSFSEFTLIWMMMNQISGVLFDASDAMMNYFEQLPQVQKLRSTFEDIPKIVGYEEGKTFTYKKGQITLDKIGFSYGEKEIFHEFNLQITGGQKTALVGGSGSGKTTLLKLLSGYIHPTTGAISIDGQKLKDIALKSYYSQIGYLTQDPNVFDGSVMENLLYGVKEQPTTDEIKHAVESSKCEFIYDFKDGLETQIGEKGVRLSGGQKQRLAIAKLFLKNPHIIFLDEPTSALDSFSEELITKAFNNLFIGRTVIIAAHRLQTVKSADTILVFGEGGNIVEQGTHTQLVNQKGIYNQMLELQSGF